MELSDDGSRLENYGLVKQNNYKKNIRTIQNMEKAFMTGKVGRGRGRKREEEGGGGGGGGGGD